ncbi:hypothetical protein ACRWQL_18070 [Shewanella sp. HL-SH4]|uniref:hypothetical protein n=1 Tax=Shewanella sp. HL-SH4 TaxID=3436240 RepID=UPI003EC07757
MDKKILPLIIFSTFIVFSIGHSVAKDKDSKTNNGKQNSEKHQTKHNNDNEQASLSYFSHDRQIVIKNYYDTIRSEKHCPPGLSKKNNGCQPPGQAKKWHKGQHLPKDVIYYDVPIALTTQLGRTPEGQKIVRIGTDLLLISVGTGMVIDALEDLNGIF